MTQLNYQIPILTNPNSSEDPKIHDALSQIQTVVNGGLDSGNITDGSIAATDLAPIEAWHVVGGVSEPAFQNSWVNVASSTLRYRKDTHTGFVEIIGPQITGGAYPSVIFTLPAGYRPVIDTHFAVVSNNLFGMIFVTNAGNVSAFSGSGSIDVSGVRFFAEA